MYLKGNLFIYRLGERGQFGDIERVAKGRWKKWTRHEGEYKVLTMTKSM